MRKRYVMCCSAAPARFRGTTLYAGEVTKLWDFPVHVLGYQNHVANRSSFAGGNAMLLHFPARPGTMTRANVLDTSHCTKFLDDMVRALRPPIHQTRGLIVGSSRIKGLARVEIFEYDIYTVVLAEDARDIPHALDQVPEDKRPPRNVGLFDFYASQFPGWPVALCCFNNTDEAKASPMLWWYEPQNDGVLHAPAIDSHTGGIPDLRGSVDMDHWVIFGSDQFDSGQGARVHYEDYPGCPDAQKYLPQRVVGQQFRGEAPNGDFIVYANDLRRPGRPSIDRIPYRELDKVYGLSGIAR